MNWGVEFILVIGLLMALMLGGMWIPFALGVAGLVSLYFNGGFGNFRGLGMAGWSMNSFTLTAIPLFIFMAEILVRSNVTRLFFYGITPWVRPLPGSLFHVNIVGSTLFASICGSSVATAAAIGTVTLPQLAERKYNHAMAAGSLVAGATLGILIPPSLAMILYGAFTETSIVKLFAAGMIPGLMLSGLFMLYVLVRCLVTPGVAPRETVPVSLRLMAGGIVQLLPLLGLITIVLGGIYAGVMTPTEAAAVGCAGAVAVGAIWGDLRFASFMEATDNAIRVSCGLLFIALGAFIFSYAIEDAGLGTALTQWLTSLGLTQLTFLILLFLIYAALGCVIDSMGMIVLTVPLLFPTIVAYDIDPVWFGIVLVLFLELGQITPPMGINLFVAQCITQRPLSEIIHGTLPYYFIIIGFVILVTVFPEIVLWLPERMAR